MRRFAIAAAAAAALVLLLRRVALHEDLDWETVDKPGRLISIGGYSVHYVEQGPGPAIVLLHGFGAHTSTYRKIIPALARDHRVVAVDLKGFGYSQRDARAGLSQTDQVAMLRRLFDALAIERAVLVGHSMGGGIAQRFAVAHPDRVGALVLLASMSADEAHRAGFGRAPIALLRPLLPLLGALAADRLLRASFYDPSFLTPELREDYLRPARIRGSMDGLLAMMRDRAHDAPIALEEITQPVLLLFGEHDPVAPPALAERIRSRISHADLVVVPDTAHLLHEERPDDCLAALRSFLEALPRRVGEAHGARI